MASNMNKLQDCDFHNILNLINRCNLALDEGIVDSFLDCFCEQGVYRVTAAKEMKEWSGRSELIEASMKSALSNSKRRAARTWINSSTLDTNGDEVIHKAFFLAITTGANPETIAFGHIEDKLTSISGQWKLKFRHTTVDYKSTSHQLLAR